MILTGTCPRRIPVVSTKLIANAVESIAVGLEDYQSGGKGRLRSTVRNLHAGILLLFKEKLRRLSPPGSGDVLLKTKIVPRLDGSGKVRPGDVDARCNETCRG